ncbi:hypothetical protein AKO1_010259 [Acrasis kona]|uniref:Guanylate cyclase domain-containing protein n=1 Tax=Acrasis kona TaxID=1008807 RepID=A0AAW2ZPT8_9EUKA
MNNTNVALNAISFEGYLVGRLITAILQSVSVAGSSLTKQIFSTTLYSSSSYSIGGINIGNYVDTGSNTCNQGLRSLQLVSIRSNLSINSTLDYNTYVTVADGVYELASTSCYGSTNSVVLPVAFNMISNGINNPSHPSFQFAIGLRGYFEGINRVGGVGGRYLFLATYDDQGDYETNQFFTRLTYYQDQVHAVVGYPAYNETQVLEWASNTTNGLPYVGILSGSVALRNNYINIIQLRTSIRENVGALLKTLKAIDRTSVVLVVKNDAFTNVWSNGVTAFEEIAYHNYDRLTPKSIIRFNQATDATFRNDLLKSTNGANDALLLLCDANDAIEIITVTFGQNNNVIYAMPNDVNLNLVTTLLLQKNPALFSQVFNRIYASQSLPTFNPNLGNVPYQSAYINAVNSTYQSNNLLSADGYEGYILARILVVALVDMYQASTNQFATARSIRQSPSSSSSTVSNAIINTRRTFVNSMYTSSGKGAQELELGTISTPCTLDTPMNTACGCSQISRRVQVVSPQFYSSPNTYYQASAPDGTLDLDSCQISLDSLPVNVAAIAAPVSIGSFFLILFLISLIICCFLLRRKQKIGHAPPTGRMVIAFTDVQSSTILWQQYPTEMRRALKIHNTIIRLLLKKHHGYEVKTQGDSFMVGFNHAYDAISWAMSVQEELLDCQEWPTELILGSYDCRMEWDQNKTVIFKGLRVRIGMHLGSAERIIDPVTNRPDFFGTTVNKAARVESCANGGQVLVSQTLLLAVSDVLVNHETGEKAVNEKWIVDLNETQRSPDGSAGKGSLKSNKSTSSADTKFTLGNLFNIGGNNNSNNASTSSGGGGTGGKRKKKSKRIKVVQECIMYKCAGEHTLKGLAGKEVLFELFVPRLATRTFEKKIDDDMRELDYEEQLGGVPPEGLVVSDGGDGVDGKDVVIEVVSDAAVAECAVDGDQQVNIELKDVDIADALNAEANQIQE